MKKQYTNADDFWKDLIHHLRVNRDQVTRFVKLQSVNWNYNTLYLNPSAIEAGTKRADLRALLSKQDYWLTAPAGNFRAIRFGDGEICKSWSFNLEKLGGVGQTLAALWRDAARPRETIEALPGQSSVKIKPSMIHDFVPPCQHFATSRDPYYATPEFWLGYIGGLVQSAPKDNIDEKGEKKPDSLTNTHRKAKAFDAIRTALSLMRNQVTRYTQFHRK